MNILIKFATFGMVGWIMEILFTGFHSLLRKDLKLLSNTSLWMFPIYGLAVFLPLTSPYLLNAPVFLRGGVYAFIILAVEYMTGYFILKVTGECPWNYSGSKYALSGIIRFDYLPVWYIAGLIFEVLNCQIDLFIKNMPV